MVRLPKDTKQSNEACAEGSSIFDAICVLVI